MNRDDAVVFLKMIKMKKEESMGVKGEVMPVKMEPVIAVDEIAVDD